MLCLSGFELYSRWVPLVSVAQQEIASFINTCGGTPLYGHPLNTDTRFIRTVSFVRQKAHIFSLKLTLFIRTPGTFLCPESQTLMSTPLYGHWLSAHCLFSLSQLCDNWKHCTLFK